jgi:hypothetical protein
MLVMTSKLFAIIASMLLISIPLVLGIPTQELSSPFDTRNEKLWYEVPLELPCETRRNLCIIGQTLARDNTTAWLSAFDASCKRIGKCSRVSTCLYTLNLMALLGHLPINNLHSGDSHRIYSSLLHGITFNFGILRKRFTTDKFVGNFYYGKGIGYDGQGWSPSRVWRCSFLPSACR